MPFLLGGYAKLIFAGGIVVVAGFLYFKGWQDANQRRAIKDLKEHSETMERINDAITEPIPDDQLDERLRDLAE